MIGLDTGHLVYNYGTKLQAYAMQTLLEKSGDKVEIIQWYRKNFGILNPVADHVKMIKKIYGRYGFRFNLGIKAYRRYRTFEKFNSKYNIHKMYGDFEQIKQQVKIYSTVFCGSDQAWLPANVLNKRYTLEFCDESIFKAAYAPSFGISEIEEKHKEMYTSFLSGINSLSVRETSGRKIIKELTGKDVPVVLDPTLLMTKSEWDVLLKEATIKRPDEKYIFCYFLGMAPEHRNAVKKYSRDNNLKIVNLQHFTGYCEADENFADYNLYDVSVQDFLFLISNAAMVCTDSFHCSAFAIQYHKKFSVFHRFSSNDPMSTNTRIYSLLNQLGLEDRIVQQTASVNDDEIEYGSVDEKLNSLRIFSSEYMDNALKGIANV